MIVWMLAPPPGDSLDACIARIAQGDQDALGQLYHRTRPAVYGFALSILKNPHDAEDALHDTYLQVWGAAGGYRSQGKPMAWLLTVVRNLCMDILRRRSRTESLSGAEGCFEDRPAVTQEDRMLLRALLEALGDEERQVVTLHALGGLKHRETAELLGLPLATVLSKYSRALKKLNAAWKEAT
ncbi:RNA polymerase sigma factor [uncultured Oscillibacter sp.]|uniref:RNA polymerase sigma factor n=1 Tax=uncultured Oscillibacter sp. TaxID=876091 RepID=UPI002805B6DC|nr:RNA polymerase sigma factor [uncultured Oscillibacter sp.]